MRVSVIGAGFGEQHVSWLAQCPGVTVDTLIYHRNRERADEIAARYGILRLSQSLDEVIENDSELVVIAAPVHLHGELTQRALKRGKSVVCEKPLALTAQVAQAMVDASESARVPCMTMFQWRFHPAFRALRDLVESRALGRVLHVDLQFHHDFLATRDTPFPWRHSRAEASAGALADLGVHLFDLLRWLTSQEYQVTGTTSAILWGSRTVDSAPVAAETEDITSVLLQSTGGTVAVASALRVTTGHRRLRATVSGTEAVAWVEVCPDTTSGELGSSDPKHVRSWPAGSLENPYLPFLSGRTALTADIPDFAAGLAAQRLLDAAAAHSPAVLSS
ncbi:Gfo/Idh/MocA family oxidoreductase [Streptomyces tirandamycinicus]|uniref:Gfo/Idh/MocA family protein n=1 Tax=Streptomyces tirandamycinicus TaxID=2174846 RepID=UPI00344614F7